MKTEIIRFHVAVAFLLYCVTGFIASGEIQAEDEQEGGEIVSLSGSVEVLLAGGEEYHDAAEDMFLEAGDTVKTGDDSYVEVAFDEEGENVVRVDENTRAAFLLEERQKIELLQGEIFSTIGNLPENETFEIRTPSAVAGIRGTDWVTRVDEEGTDIETLDGSLYVRGFDREGNLMAEETIIQPGYKTRVNRYQRPSAPIRLGRSQRERLRALRGDVRGRAQDVIRRRKLYPGLRNRRDRMKKSFEQYRKPLLRGKKPTASQGALRIKEKVSGMKPLKFNERLMQRIEGSSDYEPRRIPLRRPAAGRGGFRR